MERAGTRQRARRPRRRALACAIAVLAATAACSNGDDDDEPTRRSTTTPTTAETTTTLSPEQEVETTYLAFWEMFRRLANQPNPDDPEIRERASGEALGNTVDGLTTLQSLGRHSEFGPAYRHDVVSVEVQADRAVVTDCAVDDSRIVDNASGVVVEEGIVTELWEVTLIRDHDRWLIDHSTRVQAWEGDVPCV